MEVYELLGKREEVPVTLLLCCERYEQGLARYFAGDWAGAEQHFLAAAEGESRTSYPTPSLVMARRCEHFRQAPPAADWNFAFRLTKG